MDRGFTRRNETTIPTDMQMTGGEAVVRALEVHGVEHVFGIPGTHTLPIDR